jgi:hypothetical protein
VEKHGSESYFVLGEGVPTESVGGRERTLAALEDEVPPCRFSRMGPRGSQRQLGESIRKKIGNAMAAGGGGASQVPAGFTYLGQFIDHDLWVYFAAPTDETWSVAGEVTVVLPRKARRDRCCRHTGYHGLAGHRIAAISPKSSLSPGR